MSYLSVRGEQSSENEIQTLSNLSQLANSGENQFIRKTGLDTFENATPSSSGVSTFLGLTDTPSAYEASKGVRVNAGADALEFYEIAGGTDEKVKYDSGDPTAGYVADKIVAGDGISVAEGTGANENKLVISETDPALHLDQTTPQTIINGIPLLEEIRVIDRMHELVDKLYVDEAVASLGQRFYMLSTASGVETYYNTQITPSAEVESSVTATDPADDEFIAGWISPVGGTFTKLIAGVYDWDIFAQLTGGGNKVFRIYWTLVERKADTSEVVIATSADSNLLTTSKAKYVVPLTLSADYTVSAGSRIIGKIYASLISGASATNVVLYSEGASDSHWEIPTNKEILDTLYIPYTGATSNINLGSYDLTTTGDITGGNLSGTNTGDQVGDGITITGAGTIADPFVSSGGGLSEAQAIAYSVAL